MNQFMVIILYIIAINIIGYIVMGIDKHKAKKQVWRIPEKTLWTIACIGGATGSYVGMRSFHHKTKHTPFRLGMPLLMIAQLLLYGYIAFVS